MIVGLGLALGAGCAQGQGQGQGQGTARRALRYADESQAAYARAMTLFEAEEWPEATDAFRAIKREYGLSRSGALAELRLADIDFRQEKWAEALQGYRAWIRYHAGQAEAAYARFMIARCYVEQVPEDWVLVPSSAERDQSTVHDAEGALSRFLQQHPRATEAAEARTLLRRMRLLMARHELYVADFYASRERWNAAISRLLGVVEDFEDAGVVPEALLTLGEVYLRAGRTPEARGAFEELLQAHGRSPQAPAARTLLARAGRGAVIPVRAAPEAVPEAEAGAEPEPEAESATP
jgi:outer membrane protein assembly factor BamD